MSMNWFDLVTEKLMAEFNGLFKAGEKVMNLPNKGHTARMTK